MPRLVDAGAAQQRAGSARAAAPRGGSTAAGARRGHGVHDGRELGVQAAQLLGQRARPRRSRRSTSSSRARAQRRLQQGPGHRRLTGSLSSSAQRRPGRSSSHCSVTLPARSASSSSCASARARAAYSRASARSVITRCVDCPATGVATTVTSTRPRSNRAAISLRASISSAESVRGRREGDVEVPVIDRARLDEQRRACRPAPPRGRTRSCSGSSSAHRMAEILCSVNML